MQACMLESLMMEGMLKLHGLWAGTTHEIRVSTVTSRHQVGFLHAGSLWAFLHARTPARIGQQTPD